MSQRVKLSLDHFSLLLLGFERNFEVVSVPLDKDKLFPNVCQLVPGLRQNSLRF